MNELFGIELQPLTDDPTSPPTSAPFPNNPNIEGEDVLRGFSPLWYLYDHFDEREVKRSLIKGRKPTFEAREPKHQFRLRLQKMLLAYECDEGEFLVHYAADYFPYDERTISERVTIDRSARERTAEAGGRLWEYNLKEIDGQPLEDGAVDPRFISTQHERDPLTHFDFKTKK